MYAYLVSLPRSVKRMMLLAMDSALVPFSLCVAFALRFGVLNPFPFMSRSMDMIPLITIVGIVVVIFFRLPQIRLHSFEIPAVSRIGASAFALSIAAIAIVYFTGIFAPRSVPIIFGATFFILSVGARILAISVLGFLQRRAGSGVGVAVYGAGSAGIQLVSALRHSSEVSPVLFVDDNPSLHGLIVGGLRVFSPDRLLPLAKSGRIQRVLLAIPSASRERQNQLITKLSELPCEVQMLPSYVEMMASSPENSLRSVSPDELLGRDRVELDIPDVAKAYAGRVVLVTGAGGSIGSELCRQLMDCHPSSVVLFEQNEFALYEIERELRPVSNAAGIKLIARLGSVVDAARVRKVLKDENVEIILHGAAYKHVPLVEDNSLQGARNNVIGTQIVAEAAKDAKVERFILISTDKAVRPTNIMGATKRMAELIVQDLQTRSPATKFAMVRFGNVLGSSGSVLPLFQQQIANGGPVTVTDAEVTRFFMTIPEAARLVLLAGAFSQGGDLFVLDMGTPIKIIDVARRMITMSGRREKDPKTGEGDIEIKITGLRPGEKLYEELLTNDDTLTSTPHKKILRAKEAMLSQIEVAAMKKDVLAAIASGDDQSFRTIVPKYVDGFAGIRETTLTSGTAERE